MRRHEEKYIANIRPGRSWMVFKIRFLLNRVRTWLYFRLRAPWVKRSGMIRIPWSVDIWSPHKDVEFGDRVQFGKRCIVNCDAKFGNSVLIACDVAFVGRDDHRYGEVGKLIWDSPRVDSFRTLVEDDVWIGHGSIILAGVTIGRGSVVAAGSVVIRDVPRYSIAAGFPAKQIKKRFSDEDIKKHEMYLGFLDRT